MKQHTHKKPIKRKPVLTGPLLESGAMLGHDAKKGYKQQRKKLRKLRRTFR